MADLVDHEGEALFTDDYDHSVAVYQDTDGPKEIDIIKTNGNLWFSGNQVLEMMGFNVNDTGNSARTLRRIEHPDIIKIKDTPFRFTDGRRNRGSLICPSAVMFFVEGKTKGFHPIKAVGFSSWLTESCLEGHDADHWSPAKQKVQSLEPVFHKIINTKHEIEAEELDPLRPIGPYPPTLSPPLLKSNEIEFCNGSYRDCSNKADCWCAKQGGIRTYHDQQRSIIERMKKEQLNTSAESDEVIDDDDNFSGPGWLAEAQALNNVLNL